MIAQYNGIYSSKVFGNSATSRLCSKSCNDGMILKKFGLYL